MYKTIGIDLEDSLPSVSLVEDPCLHRLIHELHIQYKSAVEIFTKPSVIDGIETCRFELSFDDSNVDEDELKLVIRNIGERLSSQYHHSYWRIYLEPSEYAQNDLMESIRSHPNVTFATIDRGGYLCVEHEGDSADFLKSMNEFLDNFFKGFDYFLRLSN